MGSRLWLSSRSTYTTSRPSSTATCTISPVSCRSVVSTGSAAWCRSTCSVTLAPSSYRTRPSRYRPGVLPRSRRRSAVSVVTSRCTVLLPRPSWRDSSVMPSSWPARENARSTRAALRTEASRVRSAAGGPVVMVNRNCVLLCGTTALVLSAPASYGLGNPVDRRDPGSVAAAGRQARSLVGSVDLPAGLTEPIRDSYDRLCGRCDDAAVPVAVRSSATCEDQPEASFAGEHDTYLWIRGGDAVVEHVRRCWASLFTDRGIAYRLERGFGRANPAMSVGVQQMVAPRAAGV